MTASSEACYPLRSLSPPSAPYFQPPSLSILPLTSSPFLPSSGIIVTAYTAGFDHLPPLPNLRLVCLS